MWRRAAPGQEVLRLLRLASFDAYQSLAPRVPRSAPVVIVAIDEDARGVERIIVEGAGASALDVAELAADEADLVVADGMPLVWASRLQGTPLPGRVASRAAPARPA